MSQIKNSPKSDLSSSDSEVEDKLTSHSKNVIPFQVHSEAETIVLRAPSKSQPVSNEPHATNLVPITPVSSEQARKSMGVMPSVGDTAFGFFLEAELGRGSFGRVFLATQKELAGRKVALKISTNLTVESQALAQFQHTNIVPVYSVHREGSYQAVCMPFFGTITMAELLNRIRGRSSLPTTGREFVDTFKNAANQTLSNDQLQIIDDGYTPQIQGEVLLERLANGSFVTAVCWMIARLADGLQHAHERGIIHRDIKPANILVTDEGQPMLLDFSIAEEFRLRAMSNALVVGGTIPYMAPEQLDEQLSGRVRADVRSDVYSLGLVMYELLTRHYPYHYPKSNEELNLNRLLNDRQSDHPSVRKHNPCVTPGLESIIHSCLTFDPQYRYQTAGALREDLERYLNDKPMLVARERSFSERIRKWTKRHPWVTSHITIATTAACILTASGYAVTQYYQKSARLEAEIASRNLIQEVNESQFLLYIDHKDKPRILEGLNRAKTAIAVYGLPDDQNWKSRSAFSSLNEKERVTTQSELADACLLIGRAYGLLASFDETNRSDHINHAIRFNKLAESISDKDVSRNVYVQRTTLMRLANRQAEAVESKRLAEQVPMRTARDYYLAAAEEFDHDRYTSALEYYHKSRMIDPRFFWAYFGEGVCLSHLMKWSDARAAFTTAIALNPDYTWTQFNRGITNLKLGDFDTAISDFDKTLDRQPEFVDAYLSRALAKRERREFAAAIADLDTAVEHGMPLTKILHERSRLKKLLGDQLGAQIDAQNAGEPVTADGWILRGIEKMTTNRLVAWADFHRAVELEPRSITALLYEANIVETLGRYETCLALLNRVIEVDPSDYRGIVGRGLMHARLKHWPQALADAKLALEKNNSPVNLYQTACIYSLLSTHDPVYRAEATTLLGIALRGKYGVELFQSDTDFDPVRKTAEYERLVSEIKTRTINP